jgi:hypothetical protein
VRVALCQWSENCADWTAIKTDEFERRGDEFVFAGLNIGEDEAFENCDIVAENRVMGFEEFIAEEVDAGRIDADGDDAACGECVDKLRRQSGKVVVPVVKIWEGVGSQQDARMRYGTERGLQVFDADASAALNLHVNDVTRAEVVSQILLADAATLQRIVVGTVGVRAEMDG